MPVSWEISCDLCHTTPGISVATDILRRHDQLHPEVNPPLEQRKPVACGSCHGQPPLASVLPGDRASRRSRGPCTTPTPRGWAVVGQTGGTICYACHPGNQTKCLRDVHYSHGLTCETVTSPWQRWRTRTASRGSMSRAARLPQAGRLRVRAGQHPLSQFQGPSWRALLGLSRQPPRDHPDGHRGRQRPGVALQGHAGTINTCTVCHKGQPDEGIQSHAHPR